MGFFTDNFEGIETSEGLVKDLLPEQVAVLMIEETAVEKASTGSTGISLRVRCDSKYALSPNKGFFHRFYLTDAMQRQVDGFTRAAAIGRGKKRFGDPTGPADRREKYEFHEFEEAAQALATALKGRKIVGFIGIEKDPNGKFPDKNRIESYYQATQRNIEAIVAAGFDGKRIKVETETIGNVKQRYLTVRAAGSMQDRAVPRQAVID